MNELQKLERSNNELRQRNIELEDKLMSLHKQVRTETMLREVTLFELCSDIARRMCWDCRKEPNPSSGTHSSTGKPYCKAKHVWAYLEMREKGQGT